MPRDEVLLADILRYARQAARAAAGLTAAELDADPDRQSMVLWPLIALGEAAAHVSEACRAEERVGSRLLRDGHGGSHRSSARPRS